MNTNNSQSDKEISQDQNDDPEEQKDQIVEYSPKERFLRFNEELGFGAYKTVYKGYDNDSGCEIAWNVIKLQRLPQQERKRISEEISLLKNLRHQNIINFINAWMNKTKNEIVFITECLSGGSLKKYLNRIRKPRLKIIKIWCKQILAGLQYLHEQEPHPIIHRDIKCENIFVNTVNNEIRIGDLGLALTLKSDFTTSVLGTPEFMAPEIYEEKYGTPVDIYAFGMCLLEMATLQIPYKECTSAAQIYKKVSQGIQPQSLQLIQNESLKNFILKCIQNYELRPSAAQLLLDDFFKETEIDNQPIQLSTDKTHPSQNNQTDSPQTPHQMLNNQQNQESQNQVLSSFKKHAQFESPINQINQKQDIQESSSSKSSQSKQQKESHDDSPQQSQNSSQSLEKQAQQVPTQINSSIPRHDSQNSLSSMKKSQTSSNQSPLNVNGKNQIKQNLLEGISIQQNIQLIADQQFEHGLKQIIQETSQHAQQVQLNIQKKQSKESNSSQNSSKDLNKEIKTTQDEPDNKQSIENSNKTTDINITTQITQTIEVNNEQLSYKQNGEIQIQKQICFKDENHENNKEEYIKVDKNVIIDENQNKIKVIDDNLNQKNQINKNMVNSSNGEPFQQPSLVEKRLEQNDQVMRKITEDPKEIQEDDHPQERSEKKRNAEYVSQSQIISQNVKNIKQNNSLSVVNLQVKNDIQIGEVSFDKEGIEANEQKVQVPFVPLQQQQYVHSQVYHTQQYQENMNGQNYDDRNEYMYNGQSPISLPRRSDASNTPTMQNQFYSFKVQNSDEKQKIYQNKNDEDFCSEKYHNIQNEDIQVNFQDSGSSSMMQSNPEFIKFNSGPRSPQRIKGSQFFHDQQYDQLLKKDFGMPNNQKSEMINSMHHLHQYGVEQSEYASNQESGGSLDKYSNKSQEILNQVTNDSLKRISPSHIVGYDEQIYQQPISNDHSDGYSKQPSMVEIQQNEDEEEPAPYELIVLEEKELKNQKYWIRFQFQNEFRCQNFEIDNSQEDFSEDMIFNFAQQMAIELEIEDIAEQFSYDLYNLVCEQYNQYHRQISQGQRKIAQEDNNINNPQSYNESQILEIFIRNYKNYMKEIYQYLKVESNQNLKIRQQKEQIQLHRFHLNQQENQLDYESKSQIQKNQKSPQTVQKQIAKTQQQQSSQHQGYRNNNQEYFDSPETNNLQKKMNNMSQGEQYYQNNQGIIKQSNIIAQQNNPTSASTINNPNLNQNYINNQYINSLVTSNNNNVSNNSNNIGSSILHINSNQNTQGNIQSQHLSPESSLNTFEENQEVQALANFPPFIQRSGSINIQANQIPGNIQKNQNYYPSNNNNNYQMMHQSTNLPKSQNTNKNLHAQTTSHQQQTQQIQKYQKDNSISQKSNQTNDRRSDHKAIIHSQSFSNISSQALSKPKSKNYHQQDIKNQKTNKMQQKNYQQQNTQSPAPLPPSKTQQNYQQQPIKNVNQQSSQNPNQQQIAPQQQQQQSQQLPLQQQQQQQQSAQVQQQLPSQQQFSQQQQQQQQQQQFQQNAIHSNQQQVNQNATPLFNNIQQAQQQPNNPIRASIIKQQKIQFASEDTPQQSQVQTQQNNHQKNTSQQTIKQSQSQDQFLNQKVLNTQDESNNPYQLQQSLQQRQAPIQSQQIYQQQLPQNNYVQQNNQVINPPFFIQPLNKIEQFNQSQGINQNNQQISQQQSQQNQFIKSLSPSGIQNRRIIESNNNNKNTTSRPPSSGQNKNQKLQLNEQEILNQQIQSQKQSAYMISPTYSQQSQSNSKRTSDNFLVNQQQQQPQNNIQMAQQIQQKTQLQQQDEINIDQQVHPQSNQYTIQNQNQQVTNRVNSNQTSMASVVSTNNMIQQQQVQTQQQMNQRTQQFQQQQEQEHNNNANIYIQQKQQPQNVTNQQYTQQQNISKLSSPPKLNNQKPTQNISQVSAIQQHIVSNQQGNIQTNGNIPNNMQNQVQYVQQSQQQNIQINSPNQQLQANNVPQSQINITHQQVKIVQQNQMIQGNQQNLNQTTQSQISSHQQQQVPQQQQTGQQQIGQSQQTPQQQNQQISQLSQINNQQQQFQMHLQQQNQQLPQTHQNAQSPNTPSLPNNNINFSYQIQQINNQQFTNSQQQINQNNTQQQQQQVVQQQIQHNQQQASTQQTTNVNKQSPKKIDEEIIKILNEINIQLQKPQGVKIDRVNHDKIKDENEIKLVQRSLKLLLPQQQILENGHFGNYTEQMIKIYQKLHNLNLSGAIEVDLWKSIVAELKNQFTSVDNKQNVQQQKDQNKKKMIKDIQSQQSKETLSNFENKLFSDFNLNNDNLL